MSPLAGYIDNPAALQEGPRAIWLAPDGTDTAYPSDSHAEAAHGIIKRNKLTGCGHVIRCLLALGWVRIHLRWQSMNVELSRALTSAQRATLQHYIHTGAQIESAAYTPPDGDERNSRYILADGVRTLTVQQLQRLPPGPLSGAIDEGPVDTSGSLHVWIAPGGEDFLASPDHAMWALQRLGLKSFPRVPYPESAAFWELIKRGWVRLYARYGAVNFQMSGAPTEAQTRAMQRYLDLPGMIFRFADVGGRVLDSDPIRRMTAGRIAAWARQVLEQRAVGCL